MTDWRSTADCLPEKSGEYLVCTKTRHIMVLNFSKQHNEFNAYDIDATPEFAIPIKYWRSLPPIPNEPKYKILIRRSIVRPIKL